MRTKNYQPDANHRAWHDWLRGTYCCLGYADEHIQLHHVIGAAARHRTAGKLGQWFVLPVSDKAHRILERSSLEVQRALWFELLDRYVRERYSVPEGLTAEMIVGIATWSRTGLKSGVGGLATTHESLPF